MPFHRLTFEDTRGFVFNEWFDDAKAAAEAAKRSADAGLRVLASEQVAVPLTSEGLLAWLNETPNTPFMRS